MRCPYCGAEQSDGVRYCIECGKNLTGKSAKKSGAFKTRRHRPSRRKRRRAIAALIVFLLILALIACAFIFWDRLFGGNDAELTTASTPIVSNIPAVTTPEPTLEASAAPTAEPTAASDVPTTAAPTGAPDNGATAEPTQIPTATPAPNALAAAESAQSESTGTQPAGVQAAAQALIANQTGGGTPSSLTSAMTGEGSSSLTGGANTAQTPAPEPTAEPVENATPEPEAIETGTAKIINCNEFVNLRVRANANSPALGIVVLGETVNVLEWNEDGFSKVEYKGMTGYILTRFLDRGGES